MNSRIDSLYAGVQRPEPRNRALEIINSAANEYNFLRGRLKPDQSINLICTVGGREYEVTEIDSPKIDVVKIQAKTDDGYIIITAPVEQICFATIIFKKINDEPPREIGFHTTMQPKQQD